MEKTAVWQLKPAAGMKNYAASRLLAGDLLDGSDGHWHGKKLAHFRFVDVQRHGFFPWPSELFGVRRDSRATIRPSALRPSGFSRRAASLGAFFADTPDDCLGEAIHALSLGAFRDVKAEFGRPFGILADANRQHAAKFIFNVSGFVAGFSPIPGVDAQRGEIASRTLWAVRAGNKVLRMVTRVVGYAIELRPGHW